MTSAAGDQVRDLPAVGVGISDSLIKMGVGQDDNVRVLSALVKSLLQNVAQRLQDAGRRWTARCWAQVWVAAFGKINRTGIRRMM